MIVVACVLVKGYVNYTSEYVSRLKSMVRRHLPIEHAFVCLTDQAVDAQRWVIDSPDPQYPWWAKINLFDPKLFQVGQKVMYLDLDMLVVDSLLPIVEADRFTLIPHAGTFKGKAGKKIVPLYNSSCMVWTAEEGYHLYNAWSKDVTNRLWGDQDWIAERMPNAAKFPLTWFPRLSEVKAPPFPEDTKVILSKKPKNHVAARQWPWFRELWR